MKDKLHPLRAERLIIRKPRVRACVRPIYRIRCDAVLDEAGELFLVGLLILLNQAAHVLGHVQAQDVLPVNLGVELFALRVVAREPLCAETEREGGREGVKA